MATMATLIPTRQLSRPSTGLPRRGSFTDIEEFCLRALLLDAATRSSKQPSQDSKVGPVEEMKHPLITTKSLDDNILFQIPFSDGDPDLSRTNKFGRHEKKILGLWQAHEDGVHPVIMHKRKPSGQMKYSSSRLSNPQSAAASTRENDANSRASGMSSAIQSVRSDLKTDVEVRPAQEHDDNSSWGDEDGGFVHYDAWEVLNDEYAEDFGFDYTETFQSMAATLAGEEDESGHHVFKILGTSADDVSAQPHVLSPPLMDSLLNFVPDGLSMENFWLKFSLIRDGSSLFTLKQYVKATPNTILAIETTKGDVFGAFTSHIWRNHPTFYGSAPAFLWRMKHNRQTPCHSLFEQAHMESEVDCYPFSGLNDLVQVCDEDRLAMGGGKLVPDWEKYTSPFEKKESPEKRQSGEIDLESLDQGQNFGFGICLDGDLLSGTTSPCGTFRNPCLINNMSKGEIFEVANLELWTLTPCADVNSAEKMEMTRYFVEESMRSVTSSASSTNANDIYNHPFDTQDEFQRDFYRRVGHNEPTGHQRKVSHGYGHIIAPYNHLR